jgi:hypothetical protein
MKNLHLIPTEKPSRLVIDTIENKLYLQPILHKKTINVLPQHIYITSDEEIKEGDWCYAILSKQVFKNANPNLKSEDKKKIILTTDPSLAPDVQKIDDEFLEWFVKNPSCESVDLDTFSMGDKVLYNVVFPKEEPKQETLEKYHGNTVEYWKKNAEENYLTTPISVLKYITVLEEQAEQLRKFKNKGGDK